MVRVLELRAELSVEAKGNFIGAEAGLPQAPDTAETDARYAELKELRNRIGRAGMLALRPLLVDRARDLWELAAWERPQAIQALTNGASRAAERSESRLPTCRSRLSDA
jgi:hypothetical protein